MCSETLVSKALIIYRVINNIFYTKVNFILNVSGRVELWWLSFQQYVWFFRQGRAYAVWLFPISRR